MAFIGNTVRLTVHFKNLAGVSTNPSSAINLQFYDHRRQPIGANIVVNVANQISTGVYYYDYTIPQTTSNSIIYEFSTTVDGTPSVGRGQIPLRWV